MKTTQVVKAMILISALLLTFSCGNTDDPDPNSSTLTDIDGNVYQTVKIGDQVWMVENLKTTRYRNGDSIPNVLESTYWIFLNSGAYCNYNNDTAFVETYGRLYNWYAAIDPRNIAPEGWHVPSNDEWITLINFLEGDSLAGGKMKEKGTSHWRSPNTGATNESGFKALPGGTRIDNYGFGDLGTGCLFWSTSEKSSLSAYHWTLSYNNPISLNASNPKTLGMSVRCVRDN
jgi:uncharacterized protein (TIGR02145 family)